MNITSIALDDFIGAFTAALTEANCKMAERHFSARNEMKEKYGSNIAFFASSGKTLHIKRGSITVTASPILKTEAGPAGKTEKMYLKFNGIKTREMRFEVSLE
jgi:hypothetical protein